MAKESGKHWLLTVGVLGYAAAVLAIDTLAASGVAYPFDWSVLHRPLPATFFLSAYVPRNFDLFKFVAWFVIPFALCVPRMDWGYLGFGRWLGKDFQVLLGLAMLGAAAVLAIKVFPSLAKTYHGIGHYSSPQKMLYAQYAVTWTFSWLVGWEFLHRYFVLTHVQVRWPRYGWLIVPLFEGVYHLQKPLLEAGGMVVFSLLVTRWTVARRNVLLPFLAHLIIELELLAFTLLT